MAREPEILFTTEEIAASVTRIAGAISRDYADRTPLLIGVLKGAFVFLADLVRHLSIPVEIDFVKLSSYGNEMESSGEVRTIAGLEQSVEGRDVIVVEDIVDSGVTLNHFLEDLRSRGPASVKLCVLVDKTARREIEVQIDYAGMQIDDEFIVGYGIDCGEQYRYLPDIRFVQNEPEVEQEESTP